MFAVNRKGPPQKDPISDAPVDKNRSDVSDERAFRRGFSRSLATLAVPIALQNLISASVVSADILMFGLVGQSAMSAVSLAGQVTFVLTLFQMGMATGAGFLRPVSIFWRVTGLSMVYFCVARSMEKAHVGAWISSNCLLLNIGFSAVCIFVLFPGRMEASVTGVALSTVAAKTIEFAACLVHSRFRSPVRFRLRMPDRTLLRDFVRYTLPVLGNYLV